MMVFWITLCLVLNLCSGHEKALLDVVLYERSENGEIETYEYKLTGQFSAAGTTAAAEGTVVQVGRE